MRNFIYFLLIFMIEFAGLTGAAISQSQVLREPAATRMNVENRRRLQNFLMNGSVKFEETFPDSAAFLQWTILNDDGSSNGSGPTVGHFVDTLNFLNGATVAPEIPATFFWTSDFTNANGSLMDEWLISPQLPAVQTGDTLHFYGGAPDNSHKDSIQVWIATTDPSGSSAAFVHNLGRFKMNGPTGNWTEYKVALDLPGVIGSPVWLGLRYWHTDGGVFGSHTDNVWVDHILITNDAAATVTQSFTSGWNLVGLPLIVADSAAATLYPDYVPGSLFSYNGSYQSETHLARGKGFWLNFPGATSHAVTGQPLNACTISLNDGWNLIAGPNCDVPLSAVSDPGNVITPGTLFGYDGSYVSADTIKSGKGYWVLANAAGQISMSCSVAGQLQKIAAQPLDLTEFPALKISDENQHSQTLYFDVRLPREINRRVFSLPPMAPAGISAFDARFSDDLRIAETNDALIELQASDFPLTIRGEKLPKTMALIEMIGHRESARHTLMDGGVVQISNPAVNRLKLGTSGIALPNRFALLQNFPNPFNPETIIAYQLPMNSDVEIVIYDALGQKVRTLISQTQGAGSYRAVWDGRDERGEKAGSGVYVYRLEAGSFSAAKKMVLLQ